MASESARVTSMDALVRFKASFSEFGDHVRMALANAEGDVQRTIWRIQHDLARHWQQQIKKRQQRVAIAKSELVRAELGSRDERPSCVLERKALARAQQHLAEAEQKLERCKYWTRTLEREFMLYKGQTQAFAARIERDVPKGGVRLTQLMDHLDKYLRAAPPPSSGGATGASDAAPAGDGGPTP